MEEGGERKRKKKMYRGALPLVWGNIVTQQEMTNMQSL